MRDRRKRGLPELDHHRHDTSLNVAKSQLWDLHLGFGNKDFKSSHSVKVVVPSELSPVLEWIEQRRFLEESEAAIDGARWAEVQFTAGEVYEKSGYRALAKARKEDFERTRANKKAKKKKHHDDDQVDGGGVVDDGYRKQEIEIEGGWEDEGVEEEEDEVDSNDNCGGFGALERLLSVLVFNGYLSKVKKTKKTKKKKKKQDV